MADPDRRENWSVRQNGPRVPAAEIERDSNDFYANLRDGVEGILLNGILPVGNDQGVHSLTDVPVYAMGPCQELFGGAYDSTDIFFYMAQCFGLARGIQPEQSEAS
jgi:alkaline phosphatase